MSKTTTPAEPVPASNSKSDTIRAFAETGASVKKGSYNAIVSKLNQFAANGERIRFEFTIRGSGFDGDMTKKLIMLLFIGLGCLQAHAINKCTDTSGKVSFQDAPCAGSGGEIKVTPASGHVDKQSDRLVGAPPEKMIDALKDERIRREKWLVMNHAHRRLDAAQGRCNQARGELAAAKSLSTKNLTGAERDAAISREMNAIRDSLARVTACAEETRSLEQEVDAAKKVCADIKCIAVF